MNDETHLLFQIAYKLQDLSTLAAKLCNFQKVVKITIVAECRSLTPTKMWFFFILQRNEIQKQQGTFQLNVSP